jgi:hypothetical protein
MHELMAAVRTKLPPGRSWLAVRGGTAPGLRPPTRPVRINAHVNKTIGRDRVTPVLAAGAGPVLLPPTQLAPASPDRLVAALVIMIQQASRNHHLDAGTLAPSMRPRTT